MSKYIDPENMSPEDVVYVQQRATLRREFELQGLGDPTVKGYEGHDFDWDSHFDENGKFRDEPIEPEPEPNEPNEPNEPADDGEADEADEDGEEELPVEKQWSPDMTKAQLDAVIEARNADYDDDEKIGKPEKDNKQSRIDLLEQDDAELAGDEDEENAEE